MPPQYKYNHYDTPHRAMVQGAYRMLVAKVIPFDPREIFKQFGVSDRAGYKMIQNGASSRTRQNAKQETRGRKCRVTPSQVREVDHFLQEDGLQLEKKRLL